MHMCITCFGFLCFFFPKRVFIFDVVLKICKKYFVAELKNAHESERKSLEESFKEKQELLEVC